MDKLFDTKRTYTGYDGEEYVDMCIPVIKINKINAARVAKLSRDSQGRIDTFTWNTVENDLDMIDMVMYANHLFNPSARET